VGTGSYLPERVLTNEELSASVDTTDEWITTRTGIRERHICAAGEHGARVALGYQPELAPNAALFGEGPGGVVVSGTASALGALAAEAGDVPVRMLGTVGGNSLEINMGAATLTVPVDGLRAAHSRGLTEQLS